MFKDHRLYAIPAIGFGLLSYYSASSIVPITGVPLNSWWGALSLLSGIGCVVLTIVTFAGPGPYDTGSSVDGYD